MLKSGVTWVLNTYLGEYLCNINQDQISIGLGLSGESSGVIFSTTSSIFFPFMSRCERETSSPEMSDDRFHAERKLSI